MSSMLARQAVLRRATPSMISSQRVLGRQIRPFERQISLMPWRKPRPSSHLPVYFPKAPSQPPGLGLRRRIGHAIMTTVILYSCWQIFASVVLDPLLDWADAEWEAMSDKEKEEAQNMGEEDEPILFLPLPFTTHEVKQPKYKGLSPEWAEFVKVNKNPELQQQIRTSLAQEIKRSVEKNPNMVKLLGGGIALQKFWLDIFYPSSPPPKHYVSGLIIDEEGLFWGDRPIDSTAASRLDKVIYPKAVATAAWTFVNFLFKQTAQDVATALGINISPPPQATWQSVALERARERGPLPPSMGSGDQELKISGQPPKSGNGPLPSNNAENFGLVGIEKELDPRVQAALQAATLTFRKNWKATLTAPTPGCISIDGLVEVKGNAGYMGFFVVAWYDPKTRKFVRINASMKHLIKRQQNPAPG